MSKLIDNLLRIHLVDFYGGEGGGGLKRGRGIGHNKTCMPYFPWSIIFTDSQSGSYFPSLVVRMDSKAAFSFLCLSFQALVHFVQFLHSPMK